MMGEAYGNMAKDEDSLTKARAAKRHLQDAILISDQTGSLQDQKAAILVKMNKVDKITYIIQKKIELNKLETLRNKMQYIFSQLAKDQEDQKVEPYQRFLMKKLDDKIEELRLHLKYPQIPEWFNCVFTQCLMNEPFATNSGHSYEKRWIYTHVRSKGDDPVTRQQVLVEQIFENKALKEGINQFKSEYPFAEDIDLEVG